MHEKFWPYEKTIGESYNWNIANSEDFPYVVQIECLEKNTIKIKSYLNTEKTLSDYLEELPKSRHGLRKYKIFTFHIEFKNNIKRRGHVWFKKFEILPFDSLHCGDDDGILETAILHYKFLYL